GVVYTLNNRRFFTAQTTPGAASSHCAESRSLRYASLVAHALSVRYGYYRWVMIRPLALSLLAICAHAVMPLPVTMTPGTRRMPIDNSFQMSISGASDARLQGAVARATSRLSRQTGIPFIGPRGSVALRIECAAKGPDVPTLGEDESYTLDVTPNGAMLKAPTIAGAMHGIETFIQLVEPAAGGFSAASVHIEDKPRFPWRGLMLDSARHWMPPDRGRRNLDAMAA